MFFVWISVKIYCDVSPLQRSTNLSQCVDPFRDDPSVKIISNSEIKMFVIIKRALVNMLCCGSKESLTSWYCLVRLNLRNYPVVHPSDLSLTHIEAFLHVRQYTVF